MLKCGVLEILKECDLVADVVRAIVERRRANKDDLLGRRRAILEFHGGLADALELIKCLGGVIAKLMRFVHDH